MLTRGFVVGNGLPGSKCPMCFMHSRACWFYRSAAWKSPFWEVVVSMISPTSFSE